MGSVMFWTFIAFAALAYFAGWCIRSHADAGARDPGKKEVKVGSLKVLD